jgi:alpha-N-arabinofuranosidase
MKRTRTPWSLAAVALSVLIGLAAPAPAGDEGVAVKVDLRRKGAPISRYVYGQFIEHLGRCIYGGIWAEMLEDRKFFFDVGKSDTPWEMFTPGKSTYEGEGIPYEVLVASPWLVMGDKGAVRMTKEGAWAGAHSPEVSLRGDGAPAGLYQGRLGLVARKEYVGRIVLAGDTGAEPIEVSLVWGPTAGERQTVRIEHLSTAFATSPLRFTAGAASEDGRVEITSRGRGAFRIGAVSLMPADNLEGFRADTLRLLKELDAPIYRWPGGNFVSGYDWKDGIGDRDRRPPRKNPAWKGIEHNDVGIHEFMAFCRLVGAEPLVVVNTGLGGETSAREEVEYVNGAATTPMGEWRARNGRAEPFGVNWWGVGNEMYGDWQLGHVPLEEYTKKHNRVVEAMKSVDPSLRLVAVGSVGPWSEGMLREAAGHMTLMSEHFYVQQKADLVEHVEQVPAQVRRIVDAHRGYRRTIPGLSDRDIRIAIDEYNYWYGAYVFGELGTRYFLKDALGIAEGLHEMFRSSDIVAMANYAQTVNVIGAIKTTRTAAEFEATGLVLRLYRGHYGTIPVAIEGGSRPMDLHAAVSEDGKRLTIGVVNPSPEARSLSLSVEGGRVSARGRAFVVTGPDEVSFNDPGRPRRVDVSERPVEGTRLEVPALAVAVFELPLQ